ncbi:DUF2218 domain-containing protein [Jiangella alba]|nr:DUF2218 domain-containing protein [Jiangella alba]
MPPHALAGHLRHGLAAAVLVKLAFVAVLLLLPSGLLVLGVAHGVLLIVVVAAATLALLARRRSRGRDHWEAMYSGRPDWDVGHPQPAFRALADDGAIRGRVLDAGCGTGEHVLMCAARGLDATGVDVAPTALRTATEKAAGRGLTARFLRRDARELAGLGETFGTVLDCGLLHTFDDTGRAAYVAAVRAVLEPGGRWFVLCFSDLQPGESGPRRYGRDELAAVFATGWRVDRLERTRLDSPRDPGGLHGWLVALTKDDAPGATARADVATATPERYLRRLCDHAEAIAGRDLGAHHRPGRAHPRVLRVDRDGSEATLTLTAGRCTLRAGAGTLAVVVEAPAEDELRQLQDLLARDLERFGRRDGLTVEWSR